MTLNIVNPGLQGFHESVGISDERSNELDAKMDALGATYTDNTVIRTVDIASNLAEMSDNLEEFAYCMLQHLRWIYARGGEIRPLPTR
jgi:hypothetical protein